MIYKQQKMCSQPKKSPVKLFSKIPLNPYNQSAVIYNHLGKNTDSDVMGPSIKWNEKKKQTKQMIENTK